MNISATRRQRSLDRCRWLSFLPVLFFALALQRPRVYPSPRAPGILAISRRMRRIHPHHNQRKNDRAATVLGPLDRGAYADGRLSSRFVPHGNGSGQGTLRRVLGDAVLRAVHEQSTRHLGRI